jgi:thymidine kinase
MDNLLYKPGITTLFGPMNSQKTSYGFLIVRKCISSGLKCIIIKHKDDNRFNMEKEIELIKDDFEHENPSNERELLIASHDRDFIRSAESCLIIEVEKLSQFNIELVNDYQFIWIDEGHFFLDIHTFSSTLEDMNKKVLVTTLFTDYKKDYFKHIAKLIAISSKVKKLSAKCDKCKQDAHWTARIRELNDNDIHINLNDKQDLDRFVVGTKDLYITVCKKCFDYYN